MPACLRTHMHKACLGKALQKCEKQRIVEEFYQGCEEGMAECGKKGERFEEVSSRGLMFYETN